ncbi:MAG: hypothetical protein P8X65_02220 [Syntrophobacterales bacterium]|jgi:hypothetical protein
MRRTHPSPRSGAWVTLPGTSSAKLAAAVGFVSPPGGIVLWDEWHAALNRRRDGLNPEIFRKTETSVKTLGASPQRR